MDNALQYYTHKTVAGLEGMAMVQENGFLPKNVKIRERNGLYYLDGYVNGKRVHKSTQKKVTKANLKWLEKNKEEQLLKLSGVLDTEEDNIIPTLKEFGEKSLKIHLANRKENTSKAYYRIFNNYILPYFGKRRLDTIKPSDLLAWQNELSQTGLKGKGLSGKTIKNIRSVLQTILDDAFNDEIITKNPFALTKAPKVKRADVAPFSLEEITTILTNIEGKYKNMFTVAFFTGMRWGEIIGLQWQDIDFENSTIKIERSIVWSIISDPKTEASKREIEMLPKVLEALRNQKMLNPNSKWVFVTKDGENYTRNDSIRKSIWKPLLEKCNVEYRELRQTRHSFATLMLHFGEDILWVSSMMGHTDKTITLNTYAKYVKQNNTRRATFLDDVNI